MSQSDFQPVSQLSYSQAISELESIVKQMQTDALDIDRLAAYTRRATELLNECRQRLMATDKELQSILGNESSPI